MFGNHIFRSFHFQLQAINYFINPIHRTWKVKGNQLLSNSTNNNEGFRFDNLFEFSLLQNKKDSFSYHRCLTYNICAEIFAVRHYSDHLVCAHDGMFAIKALWTLLMAGALTFSSWVFDSPYWHSPKYQWYA